ncbi:MAG: hypothetical protein RL299_55 [Pseudomonadota bacterium]|jgi:hypothetical protein
MRKTAGLLASVLALTLAALPGQLNAQASGFLGPDRWWDPAPATYQLNAVGSNLCVTRATGDWIGQAPYLKLRTCDTSNFSQMLELAPAAVDVPPAPMLSNTRWRVNNQNQCATVARGVVFGPPRVDMHPCDQLPSAGGDTAFRGGLDQSFFLRRVSSTNVVFRTADNKCWTVQGGNLSDGTQLVVEPCTGMPNQTFALRYSIGVMDLPNMASAERFGWFRFDPGVAVGLPDRFRSLPGLDLPGHDLASLDTDNDQGMKCARTCAENNRCRSYTWVAPGYQAAGAKCWLKSFTPDPVATAGVRSGIVRPQ